MYKMNIKYTDFNDENRAEDFYFNLTKAEISEMNLSHQGGMEAYINRIINSRDNAELVIVFKDLILRSYGIKSDDGKRFIKSQQLRDEFEQTNAYSELFMMLATNSDAASKFINGIMPKDYAAEVAKQSSASGIKPAT